MSPSPLRFAFVPKGPRTGGPMILELTEIARAAVLETPADLEPRSRKVILDTLDVVEAYARANLATETDAANVYGFFRQVQHSHGTTRGHAAEQMAHYGEAVRAGTAVAVRSWTRCGDPIPEDARISLRFMLFLGHQGRALARAILREKAN